MKYNFHHVNGDCEVCPFCGCCDWVEIEGSVGSCVGCKAVVDRVWKYDVSLYPDCEYQHDDYLSNDFMYLNKRDAGNLKDYLSIHINDFKNVVGGCRNMLEIGCDRGDFLCEFASEFDLYGCDVRNNLRTSYGIKYRHVSEPWNLEFSVISLIHTIEHLDGKMLLDLKDYCLEHLVRGGYLYVVTNSVNPIPVALHEVNDPEHHALPTIDSLQILLGSGFKSEVYDQRADYTSMMILRRV